MTPAEAVQKATELNESGRYKQDWFYYPAYHTGTASHPEFEGHWFVMRRLKTNCPVSAVNVHGQLSVLEK